MISEANEMLWVVVETTTIIHVVQRDGCCVAADVAEITSSAQMGW